MQYLLKKTSVLLIIFLSVAMVIFFHTSFSNDVRAIEDDDQEQEDEEDKEDEYEEVYETYDVPEKSSTVTETVTISETVSKETITTTQIDKDGDGIFDDKDQYPDINNYFIVKDDNRNGIVDTYEK